MDKQRLVAELNEEIDRLQKAVELIDSPSRKAVKDANGRSTSYTMSPASRKRISDAQKARWEAKRQANVKKERAAAAKKTAKK